MDFIPMVVEKDGIPITTSKAVAEQFGKQHKHVLRAIEDLKPNLTAQFWATNFILTTYENRGKGYPLYIITKDGFLMLVMGFTGPEATQFKEAYINAFNQMQCVLSSSLPSTVLQSIERRLTALEAGENMACKEERQSDIFLKALQDALDSGEYYIRPKRAHAPELCASRLLGVYDRHEIAIRSLPAYALYQAATSRPMRIRTLWEVLEREGTIAPRTEAGRICRISGKECAAVFISRNGLTVGGRG